MKKLYALFATVLFCGTCYCMNETEKKSITDDIRLCTQSINLRKLRLKKQLVKLHELDLRINRLYTAKEANISAMKDLNNKPNSLDSKIEATTSSNCLESLRELKKEVKLEIDKANQIQQSLANLKLQVQTLSNRK